MRIAVVNHSLCRVGGTESYLDAILPELLRAGHELACLYEVPSLAERESISVPNSAPRWCVGEIGSNAAVHRLRSWGPDICFAHGLLDPELEQAIVTSCPSALYAHNYYGTCISGNKSTDCGISGPCERRFGGSCLLRYFPNRCGGRNPFTMWTRYRLQARRLELMHRYRVLLTNSQHMVREFARHDLVAKCLYPFTTPRLEPPVWQSAIEEGPLRLLFSGRMHFLKGGHVLLAALPLVRERLGRDLHVTFAGGGPDRDAWQTLASTFSVPQFRFDFVGWLPSRELNAQIRSSHLNIMPSLWPEPFGLSGLEAGCHGIPTVAFAVGGIPEWLHDGVNGCLAQLPPSPSHLADAICRAFSSPSYYLQLCNGAFAAASRFTVENHIVQLMQALNHCAR